MAEPEQTEQEHIDINRVNEFIAERVKENHAALMAEYQRTQQQQQPQQPQVDLVQQERQQVRDYLNPIIGADLAQSRFLAADASDRVDFYMNNPYAKEYSQQVEEAFKQAAANGRPTTRSNILQWLVGQEYTKDPASFNDKMEKRKQAQLDEARSAMDVAGGTSKIERDTMAKMGDFGKLDSKGYPVMKSEEMEQLMEGMAF